MAEGRQRAAWQHTSLLAAPAWNAGRDPKKKPLKPSDFDPFAARDSKAPKLGMADLETAFRSICK